MNPDKALYIAWRESRYRPSAYNAAGGAAGIYQHLLKYWPDRAADYGFRDWSAFNARANIMVTMRMVKQYGWAPWGALSSGSFEDRTARARERPEHLPHVIAGRCHRVRPGRVPIRHDPHRGEPLPNEGDQTRVRAERDHRVRPFRIDHARARPPRWSLPA